MKDETKTVNVVIVHSSSELKIDKTFKEMTLEEKKMYLRSLDATDDTLFTLILNNDPEVAAVLAKGFVDELKDITITRVTTQKELRSFGNKSVVFDALAETDEGTMIDFEMQRQNETFFEKRMRYYSSAFTINYVAAGEDYVKVPSYVQIIFSRKDILKKNKAVYVLKWKDEEGDEADSSEIKAYVNLSYVGDDDKGKLIHDLLTSDYNDIGNAVLKKKVAHFKEEEIDVYINKYTMMAEREREAGRREGREEGLKEGLKEGEAKTLRANILSIKNTENFSPERIAKLLNVSLDVVEDVLNNS